MKQETKQALRTASSEIGSELGDVLRKRRSLPTWAFLVILAVFVVTIKLPDQGSYYHKEQVMAEGRQQTITDSIVKASVSSGDALVSSDGPIPGLDVSKWQGEIDWEQVAGAGFQFAIIKATEGVSYTDPYFAANWEGAKAAGLLVSAYHMLWPNLSAEKQAAYFLATLGERKADLPLALDVEKAGQGNIGAVVEACAIAIEVADGRKPFIYTAQSFWGANVGWGPGWSSYPAWVADYEAVAPAMPKGWDEWTMWQYSNTGRVPGISGNVDLNWWRP